MKIGAQFKFFKVVWCFLLVVILFVPICVFGKDKIVIGQAWPLSGPVAAAAKISGGTIYEMWVKEVNKAGGIYVKEFGKKLPVEHKIYDNESDIGKTTKLLEKLILEDKVDFVLPPWGTAWLYAAATICNKYGYILIGGPGGAAKLKELDLPYFFQVLNFSETQGPALAQIYKEIGVKTAAVLHRGDLHGIEYGSAIAPHFKEAGIEVKMMKSFPPDATKDFTPLLKEAKGLGVDAFVVACYPHETIAITEQAIATGINFNAMWMSVGPYDPVIYRDTFGASVVEGVMGGGAWNAKTSKGAAELVRLHKEYFKAEPDYWGALYYWSSLQHFQQAIEKAGTLNQKAVRDVLATAKFQTALGTYYYDKRRFLAKECHPGEIGQWQKGVFEVVDVGPKRTAKPLYPKPSWPKKK
ncbi:MAG: amino acid ABC transporter substrate-binding protein [Deltaproteobacteria bacterium]|nr:amino acid ABC transporter substrate-binding protein [Deltaproteobacteria bacterium]